MAKVKSKDTSVSKETEVKDTDTSTVAEGKETDTKDTSVSKETEVKDTDTSAVAEGKGADIKDTASPEKQKEDKASTHEKKCVALALKYFKNYKGEKVLHITSDYQVFLSHNKGLALAHQRTIPEGVLTTVSAEAKIVR